MRWVLNMGCLKEQLSHKLCSIFNKMTLNIHPMPFALLCQWYDFNVIWEYLKREINYV